MIQITTLENIWLGCTLFFLTIYLLTLAAESKPQWFFSKTFLKCRQFQKKYQKMVSSRRDMLHHYYRFLSENQNKKAKGIEKDIIKLDDQLQQMRGMYGKIRQGLPVPLKLI